MSHTPLTESIKRKVEELDLERKIATAAESIEHAVLRGVEVAGGYAHEKRADIDGLLTKASSAIDARTEGKYADKLAGVRTKVNEQVALLAERRQVDPDQ